MHKIGRLLSGLFLVLVFIASVTFSYFNNIPVVISYGSYQFPSQPVSVWIIGAFVLGGSLGLLLGLRIFKHLKSRVEIRRLSKELAAAKEEVNRLRSLSLKDLN
ncbi:MAG: LapA family protein [Gammaproteobacteria bacterium]